MISSRGLRGFRSLVLVVLAGCANAQVAADAGVDSGPPPDTEVPDAEAPDAATSSGFFLDDLLTDFDGGTLTGAVIESWGAIAPRAYYTGALRLRAADAGVFTDAITTTWATVDAMAFTAALAPGRVPMTTWGAGIPAGAGLTAGDDFTFAYDGEVWLEAGTWTFYVLADDHAFLELAPPNTTTFSRVASANSSVEASGSYNAPVAGWYPVRLAFCEQAGSANLRVQLTGPGTPARVFLSRHRLRFSASGLVGLAVAGFDDGRLTGDHQVSIDRTAPAAKAWSTGQPADLGITAGDDFSVRWSGQLRIDDDGDYAFRYLTEDGQRLWIDGVPVLDQLDDSAHDATTAPITLAAGWHDVVADVSESTGSAQAFLAVATGPELVGAQLPLANLRPVEARTERFDAGADHTDRAIPDVGQVEASIAIDAPAGAKAYGVDVGFAFDHTYQGDLEITLIAPDGTSTIVRDHVGGGLGGTVTQRLHTTALDESTASGTWRLRARDTVSLDTGTLRDFTLTVHHHAGQPPITETASYVSSVKDLGEMVTEYRSFAWHMALDAGTAVRFYVRSGDTEAALATAPWSSPLVDPEGGAPPVPARRYFQYRIELDSDGDGAAQVDWVRLDVQGEIQ